MNARPKVSPPALARRWTVNVTKVLGFIASGELRAVDLSTCPGVGRPRWKIDEADIEAFETRRLAKPPEPKPRRRRRKVAASEDYFA